MIIKRIDIENFGKFSGFSISLNNGFNLIFGNNEDGKSTLMSFIKLMFYGNSSGKGADISKNLRKKYTPWNGSPMSGSVEFETDGSSIRLHKEFKKSAATDKTTVFAPETGEKLSLSSSEEAGENYFGMDLGEFERSVFIETFGGFASEASGDSLAMRIANLSVSGNENFSQQAILKRIAAATEELISKSKKKGLLTDERAHLESLLYSLEEHQAKTNSQLSLMSEISHLKEEILALEKSLEETEIYRRTESAKKELMQLNILSARLRSRKELLDGLHELGFDIEFLPEFIDGAKKRVDAIPNIPENISAKITRTEYDRIAALKEQKSVLTTDKNIWDAEIIPSLKQAAQEHNLKQKKVKRITTAIIASMCSLGIAGLATSFFHLTTGLILLLSAIIVGLFYLPTKKQLTKTTDKESKANPSFEKLSFYTADMAGMTPAALQELLNNKLAECANLLDIALAEYNCKNFEEFAEKATESIGLVKLRTSFEDARNSFTEYVSAFCSVSNFDDAEHTYREALRYQFEYNSLCREITLLCSTLGITEPSAEELTLRISALNNTTKQESNSAAPIENSEAIKLQLSEKRHRLGELQSSISLPRTSEAELLQQIAESREKVEFLTDRYETLNIVSEVMDSAISEMNKGLGSTLSQKTGEYLQKMSGGKYSDVMVSRDLSVEARATLAEGYHEWKFFSSGAIDRVYLALRLAATDIIAEKHNPLPLFLDDILVRYDDESCRHTLEFLKDYYETSGSVSQIIFFTCHKHIADMAKEILPDLNELSLS